MKDDSPRSHLTRTDWMLLGASALVGGVILAPAVLPLIGIGSYDVAAEIATAMHGTGTGSGLAGLVNSGIGAVPLVGEALAKGGLTTALTAGGIGIGGLLWGERVAEADKTRQIPWGRIIKAAALATTVLIALPGLLTGISVGIAFLADVVGGVTWSSQAITFLAGTVGSTGAMDAATSATSLGAIAPHLLTCGTAALPLAGSWAAAHHRPASHAQRVEMQQAQANAPARG